MVVIACSLLAACVPVAENDSVPSTPTTAGPAVGPSLVLLGDSLMQESASFIGVLQYQRTMIPRFFGGTAPCDWLDDDLFATASSVVVMSFTGNSLTPCMSDGSGGFRHGQALVERYRSDTATLIERSLAAGASVLLVGQPIRAASVPGNDEVAGLNEMYRTLALADRVGFVDAGAAVENPDGSFAASLPCASYEPTCDPSGSNPVRSDDGLHFCPGLHSQPCPLYSSGAFRFAWAIALAVADPAPYE